MTKEVGLPRKRGGHGASANRRAADLYAYEIAPIIAELKASGIRPTAGHRRRIAQATGAHSAGRSERFPGVGNVGTLQADRPGAGAEVEIAGDLDENVVTGQIRPFFLIFRTGPPYSRPYDILVAFFERHPPDSPQGHKGVAKVFT